MTWIVWLSACAPSASTDDGASDSKGAEGAEPGDCNDQVDNDEDGSVDCDDADCSDAEECVDNDTDIDNDTDDPWDTDIDTDNDTGGLISYDGSYEGESWATMLIVPLSFYTDCNPEPVTMEVDSTGAPHVTGTILCSFVDEVAEITEITGNFTGNFTSASIIDGNAHLDFGTSPIDTPFTGTFSDDTFSATFTGGLATPSGIDLEFTTWLSLAKIRDGSTP